MSANFLEKTFKSTRIRKIFFVLLKVRLPHLKAALIFVLAEVNSIKSLHLQAKLKTYVPAWYFPRT